MPLTDGSQSTGLVSCFLRSATMAFGSVPGAIGLAFAFMKIVQVGGLMLGSIASSFAPNFSAAGAMRSVWKPPLVFKTLACNAPFCSASSFKAITAFSVPAQEKPLGKSSLAIWQTPLGSFFAASAQSCVSLGFSMPATESIACLPTAAASCMASPLSLTSSKPSLKLNTPAAQRAVYSPRESPAMTWARVTASSFSPLSFSTPARPAMNIAGWQYLVSSSFASGPLRQRSRMSMPKTILAVLSIS
mmetsp:Transcript_100521/g.183745  ORF Transcript_100521/g.183745 Transcript_100521/m.183745 type:complete len:246 (+) Transcript_100521:214-951(+)